MIGNHLADDAALGRLVRGLGLTVKLAPIIPTTSIPEVRISSLLQHELRWAVTMRSVAPVSFGISLIQYSTVWAGLALVMSPLDPIFVGNFLLLTAIQWRLAASVDKGLGITTPISPFLIPFRELLSVGVTICSFFSSDVKWRGQDFRVGKPRQWFTRVHVRRCLTVGNIYEIGEIGND
jgi:ceramide glucosyltransferase